MPRPYIYTKMTAYSVLYKDTFQVLEHMFATLGAGVKANSFNRRKEGYFMDFDPNTPLVKVRFVYPHIADEKYQPYQQFVGLDGVRGNFKEAMDYFLKCIEATSLEEYISKWSARDITSSGGEEKVLREFQVWKDYVPVIRQMYGIRK